MDIIISGNENIINLIESYSRDLINEFSEEKIKFLTQQTKKTRRNQYKCSEYNYCANIDDKYIIYNTLYNSLVRMNNMEYLKYLGSIECEDDLKNEFIENGLWIENNLDEFKIYLEYANFFTRSIDRPLNLTIATTLKCNARCNYCYEKGVKQYDIKKGIEESIINFIKNKNKKYVNINWFGGEPLMNMEFMDTLSKRLKNENIIFTSYIITNGSLINDYIINEKLKLWNVNNIQITIDGTKEEYERRKNYYDPQIGEYYNILLNIKKLAEKGINLHLRINIDKNNVNDILELIKELDSIFGKYDNVVFYPAFITGTNNSISEENKFYIVRKMLENINNPKKLTTGNKLYSSPKLHACMNNDPNSFSIDIEGNIYTCEHNLGKPKYAIGTIEDGLFDTDRRIVQTMPRDECCKCVFLPKCMGGCKSNLESNDSPCMIEKYIIKAYIDLLLCV